MLIDKRITERIILIWLIFNYAIWQLPFIRCEQLASIPKSYHVDDEIDVLNYNHSYFWLAGTQANKDKIIPSYRLINQSINH